jgi:type IV pilus assembly protein PilZ
MSGPMTDFRKRKFDRLPVSLKVAYKSRGELAADLVTDLSPGGLFIRTSKPLEIGTEVELQILIEEGEEPMQIRGKVVWLRVTPDKRDGMGIQFTGVLGPVLHDLVHRRAAKG